jgi:hypothetical protein
MTGCPGLPVASGIDIRNFDWPRSDIFDPSPTQIHMVTWLNFSLQGS